MHRALIVRQPWVDLILSGQKTWEMRSRKTNVVGSVGIIEQGTGLIVGRAVITGGAYRPTQEELLSNHARHCVDDIALLEKWCFAWTLEQAERFEKPIAYDHPRGAVTWVKI
jgi:hypothetical protein